MSNNIPEYIKNSKLYRSLSENKKFSNDVIINGNKFKIPLHIIKNYEQMDFYDFKKLVETIYFWEIDKPYPKEFYIYMYNNNIYDLSKILPGKLNLPYYKNQFNLILKIIEEGNLNFISYMFSEEKFKIEEIFVLVCSYSNLKTVKFFLEYYGNLFDIHYNNDEFFKSACLYGNLEIVEYFVSLSHNYPKYKFIFDDKLVARTCLNGNFEIATYLINLSESYTGNKINIHFGNEIMFNLGCIGKLDFCKYLISLTPPYSNYSKNKIDIYSENNKTFKNSCNKGCTETIKYLIELSNTYLKGDFKIYEVFNTTNNEESFKYLFSSGNFKINEEMLLLACKNEDVKKVKFLIETNDEKFDINKDDNLLFKIACFNDNLDLLNYLLSLTPPYGNYSDKKFDIYSNKLFNSLCEDFGIKTLKFLVDLTKNGDPIDIHCDNNYGFEFACNEGYDILVKYLLDLSFEKKYGKYEKDFLKRIENNFSPNINFLIKKYLE